VWSSCHFSVCGMEIGARWRGHPPDTAACYTCRLPFHGVHFWNVNKVHFWKVNQFRYISSIPWGAVFLGLCACLTLFSGQKSPSATLANVLVCCCFLVNAPHGCLSLSFFLSLSLSLCLSRSLSLSLSCSVFLSPCLPLSLSFFCLSLSLSLSVSLSLSFSISSSAILCECLCF